MLNAHYIPYELSFVKPAVTSRNTLFKKKVYLLFVRNSKEPNQFGLGEVAPFEGLSTDAHSDFEKNMQAMLKLINEGFNPLDLELEKLPSFQFGLETALLDLAMGGKRICFYTNFTQGIEAIPINGLIWMDTEEAMLLQIENKIQKGFNCIKMKIGALDFDAECRLLEKVRKKHNAFKLELRVDANGAFPLDDAVSMLKELKRFDLHSIEQPIKTNNPDAMAALCRKRLVDIALDEELIGVQANLNGFALLKTINPQYIILKPGILGGFNTCDAWIAHAQQLNIPYWITSALESNVGLNAIAQYAASKKLSIPQGLGTGSLFENNFRSPLFVSKGYLYCDGNSEDLWFDFLQLGTN